MAYNNVITRNKADALIPTQTIINEIIQGVINQSSALSALTKLPNMTSKQARMPVLGMLPEGFWVNGDTGLKQTTELMWRNKFITAEELAVIVPIPEAVLADSEYDIWAQIEPRIVEAFGKKIDEAIFLGKDKPASWREGLVPSIINAGANITPSANDNLYTQISKAMAKVETSGFNPDGILGSVGLKQAFREGLLDTTGQPLDSGNEVVAMRRMFMANGAWDNTLAKFIVGDFKQGVYAIRQDITFKLLDQTVLTDSSNNIILNLAQQDCVALRCVMRLGWEVPNAINSTNPDEETRFPFALVEPASAPSTVKVTFTVTDSSSSAVAGARVAMGGQVKKTNSSGVAEFKTLGNADYFYEVTKDGVDPVIGKTTVASSNVSVSVTDFQ